MRHGKSSWDLPVADFDRPLNKRGVIEATEMGKYITDTLNTFPQLIHCSAANRTQETLENVTLYWNHKFETQLHESLYHAPVDQLIKFAQSTDDSIETQLIIAHNPGMAELQSFLNISREPHMPTSACIVLGLKIQSWKDFGEAGIDEYKILKPSQLFER